MRGTASDGTAYSRRILSIFAVRDAVVPEIWPFEIANVLFVSFTKRKRISEPQIKEYLELLTALPIRVEPGDLWVNVRLESRARRWNLSAYDAAYLHLALRRHVPLATRDDDFRKVAQVEGIELLL